MNKLIAGFMVMFFLLSVLSGIMDGSAGAVAATNLDGAVDDDDATITVDTTTGFLSSGGILFVGDEKMEYTGVTATTFTGLDRGFEDTKATAHPDDRPVFNEDLGVINYAMGFRAIRTGVPGGEVDVVAIPWNFVTITLPRIILWDYGFLEGDFILVRYVLMSMSVGFVIYLTFLAVNTIMGIMSKVIPGV